MMLLESTVRLMAVGAVFVWLPGWLAARRPLWPAYLLHCTFVGFALHFGLLVLATTLSQRVEWVTAFVLWATTALVLLLGFARWWRPPAASAHVRTLDRSGALAVAACVGLAAVLRWFHNYHFDDFQHLVYLTEIERQGVLFPRQLMLHVDWGLTERALIVSRYPLWAVEHVVLARLGGVPLGDSYYVLGLALLGLTLGLITAVLRDLLSSRLAALACLAALLAGGYLLTHDELLNFGGYPFQAGKLFVFLAGLALLAYGRTKRPVLLMYAGTSLFIAPLLHTNNILGVAVLAAATGFTAVRTRSRPLLAMATLPAATVLLVGGVAIGSGGFVRLVSPESERNTDVTPPLVTRVLPENPTARLVTTDRARLSRPPAEGSPFRIRLVGRLEEYNILEHEGSYWGVPGAVDLSELSGADLAATPGVFRDRSRSAVEAAISKAAREGRSIDELAVGSAGNIRGRLMLFLRRAMPLELLPVLLVIAAFLGLASRIAVRPAATGAVLLACGFVVLAHAAGDLLRQVSTTTFKPGYFGMRSSLLAADGLVRGQRILTDPITHVYGNAAGWRLPHPPPFSLEEQFTRLLMFHPAVRGQLVGHLLAEENRRLLVINEAVLGPAVGAKFEAVEGVERLLQAGQSLPPREQLATAIDAAVQQLYSLDYASIRRDMVEHSGTVWRMLFRRPLHVFAVSTAGFDLRGTSALADSFEPVQGETGAAERSTAVERRPFLNTLLLRTDVPGGCFSGVQLRLEGTASFNSPVLIHVLPIGRAAGHWTSSAEVEPNKVASTRVDFVEPVCGPGEVTFFVHGNRLYDFRFRVQDIDWMRNRTEPVSHRRDSYP